MINLLTIVGSNAKTSTNRMLAEYISTIDIENLSIEDIDISNLPLKNFENLSIDSSVNDIEKKISSANGLIILSPEYVNGPSSVMMNFLDWMSHVIHPLTLKPCLLMTASHGNLGHNKSMQMLRQILESPAISALVYPKNYLLNNSKVYFEKNDHSKKDEIKSLLVEFQSFILSFSESEKLVDLKKEELIKWD